MVYMDLLKNRKVISILPFKRLADEFHYRSKLVAIDDTTLYLTGQFAGFYKMHFSPATGSVKLYPEKYFPFYLCLDILKGKDNTLWIATNKGLFHQDLTRSQVQLTSIPTFISDSVPNARVNDIKIIGENVYVATWGTCGLLVFDKKTFQFTRQFTYQNPAPPLAFVNCLMPLDNTSLLLGTGGPMYRFNVVNHQFTQIVPEKWEEGDWTNAFFKTRAGNIWMSCEKVY